MTEDKLKLLIYNVSNDKDGYEFIKYLLEKSNCFSRSNNFICINQDYYNRGRKDFGNEILDLVQKYNFKKFVELQEERIKNS